MKITTRVENQRGRHEIVLTTNGRSHSISIPVNDPGIGSKANGGELLAVGFGRRASGEMRE